MLLILKYFVNIPECRQQLYLQVYPWDIYSWKKRHLATVNYNGCLEDNMSIQALIVRTNIWHFNLKTLIVCLRGVNILMKVNFSKVMVFKINEEIMSWETLELVWIQKLVIFNLVVLVRVVYTAIHSTGKWELTKRLLF